MAFISLKLLKPVNLLWFVLSVLKYFLVFTRSQRSCICRALIASKVSKCSESGMVIYIKRRPLWCAVFNHVIFCISMITLPLSTILIGYWICCCKFFYQFERVVWFCIFLAIKKGRNKLTSPFLFIEILIHTRVSWIRILTEVELAASKRLQVLSHEVTFKQIWFHTNKLQTKS